MSFVKALSAGIVGAVALSMGCSDGGSELGAHGIDDPLYSALTGGSDGTNGQNHLHPHYYIKTRYHLYHASTQDLADLNPADGSWHLASNLHTNALKATAGGREVLKYAIQCALPAGQDIFYEAPVGGSNVTFVATGQGFLTTTTDWDEQGLTTSQAQDLFTCVVAHMNPYAQVDINLSGENVANDPNADTSQFTFEEALWQVNITAVLGGTLSIKTRVWPLEGFLDCQDAIDNIDTRICGTYEGSSDCDVDVRSNVANECFQGAGGWWCKNLAGKYGPVIKSRLKAEEAPYLYKTCN
jgi:hypothetical protein